MKKILLSGLMVLFFVGLLCENVLADVNADVEVSVPSSITVGESFTLQLRITPDGEDIASGDTIELKIYFEGTLIHEDDDLSHPTIADGDEWNTSISSSTFSTDKEGKIWTKNLMNYQCGEDQEFKAEISGDVSGDGTDEMTIEPDNTDYELSFSMDPESPTLDDKLKVTVKDEDNEDLKDATVKITYYGSNGKWDDDDDNTGTKLETDTDGEVEVKLKDEFDDDSTGTFQTDVYKKDKYCKETKTFDISKNLILSDPDITPQAGKTFKIKVTNEGGSIVQGALATLSGGPSPIRSTTDASGYASFTVLQAGTYDLVVSKTGYTTSSIKTITVTALTPLSVSLQKTAYSSGETAVITVKSEGTAISGATVKITLPDGTSTSPGTSSDGTVSYTPVLVGTYSITASKTGYSDAAGSFRVENNLNIAIPDNKQKIYGKTTKVKITDDSGNTLSGATVVIAGTTISGLTDASGEYSFTAPEPGSYKVTVSKTGFAIKESTLTVGGTLTVKVEPKQASLGEQVNITVLNDANKPTSADITVTYPDGTTEKHTTDVLTFSKETAGKFNVTATKDSFDDGTASFMIKPKELQLKTAFNKNELTVAASSGGQPVVGLTIQIETPAGEIKTATTDESGTVMIAAESTGDYKISAVSGIYESGAIKASKKGINWWLIALAILILIVFAVIVIIALLHAGRRKKSSFEPGKKAKLQG